MERSWRQPAVTGLVAAAVGFAGTSAVVLAGLRAAGATPGQAAAGLMALCVTQGAGMVWLSRRYRQPITLAWSTPGAALLVSGGAVAGGWRAAVGAFVVGALLTAVIALSSGLSRLVARVPTALAQAMLAGVLLPICLKPVGAVLAAPAATLPVVAVWLVLLRLAARWATAGAFLAAVLVVVVLQLREGAGPPALPVPVPTLPAFDPAALVALALPLVLVTMAAQNLPGAAVLAAHGYAVPWRPALLTTAGGSLLGAFAGGHAVNLAAITAALPASAEAHPDPARRWIASSACGWVYLGLAGVAPLLAALLDGRASGVVAVVAGLALLGTLASALTAALADAASRLPAAVTVVVGASPLTLLGVGAAAWSLVLGGLAWAVVTPRAPRAGGRPASG